MSSKVVNSVCRLHPVAPGGAPVPGPGRRPDRRANRTQHNLVRAGSWRTRWVQRRQAAAIYTQLMLVGESSSRAVAVLGLLCSGATTDMERLISTMGRHSPPSRRHLASHGSPGLPETLEGTSLLP
jgi:hypothetical protein